VRLFDKVATQYAVNILHDSTIEVKKGLRGGELLQRSCFAAFREVIQSACALKENTALLVYGPRGVGKSTMVAAALQVIACCCLCKLSQCMDLLGALLLHWQSRSQELMHERCVQWCANWSFTFDHSCSARATVTSCICCTHLLHNRIVCAILRHGCSVILLPYLIEYAWGGLCSL
jgi:hypothetical protein